MASQYLQVPQPQSYIIDTQKSSSKLSNSHVIMSYSPSNSSTIRVKSPVRITSPARQTTIASPIRQQEIIIKKMPSPSPRRIITPAREERIIISPERRAISPVVQHRDISPVVHSERNSSPCRVLDRHLNYDEVMNRMYEDKKKKQRLEIQMLEAEMDEEENPKVLALKKKIRTLEVQNRLQYKENKKDNQQVLELKSKNILLESQVKVLQKQVDDEQKEKQIMEQILMQKIADLQIQNQNLSQLIQESGANSPAMKGMDGNQQSFAFQGEDYTIEGSTAIHQKHSRKNSGLTPEQSRNIQYVKLN